MEDDKMSNLVKRLLWRYSIPLFCGHYFTLLAIKIDIYSANGSGYINISIAEVVFLIVLSGVWIISNRIFPSIIFGIYMIVVSLLILPRNIRALTTGVHGDLISIFTVVGYTYFLVSGIIIVYCLSRGDRAFFNDSVR